MPAAAAWAAERLFLRPPRFAPPERERDLLERARPEPLRLGGRRIATWTWGAGPRILLVHGWGGRGGQLGAFIDPLVARGFSVAWFDGPAHGASHGRLATLPEMAEALRGVAAALGPVRGLVAHSAGAVASGLALRRWLLEGVVDLPQAIALLAPPADFAGHLRRFGDAYSLSAAARAGLARRLAARVGHPPEALDLPRFAGDLPVPALVVHDRDDPEVPWAEGAAVAAAWRGAELLTTRGLGHRRILRDETVLARVAEFLGARIPPESGLADRSAALAALC